MRSALHLVQWRLQRNLKTVAILRVKEYKMLYDSVPQMRVPVDGPKLGERRQNVRRVEMI